MLRLPNNHYHYCITIFLPYVFMFMKCLSDMLLTVSPLIRTKSPCIWKDKKKNKEDLALNLIYHNSSWKHNRAIHSRTWIGLIKEQHYHIGSNAEHRHHWWHCEIRLLKLKILAKNTIPCTPKKSIRHLST